MRNELKRIIRDNWTINRKHNNITPTINGKNAFNSEIDRLFELNNAGIDIDIYPFMNY